MDELGIDDTANGVIGAVKIRGTGVGLFEVLKAEIEVLQEKVWWLVTALLMVGMLENMDDNGDDIDDDTCDDTGDDDNGDDIAI